MKVVNTIESLHNQLIIVRNEGQKIGFIPTMGALHQGHISLISTAQAQGDYTVCSIFVNPTQFNDPADYANYPITIDHDIALLTAVGCDILFLPSVQEMYPTGYNTPAVEATGYLSTTLEGDYRPGHFDGMLQIVEKLLQAVQPHRLYMGQKDYQQAMICRAFTRMRFALNPIEVVICPIIREADGLAMSSRNVRLNPQSRLLATQLYQTLLFMKGKIAHLTQRISPSLLQLEAEDRLKGYTDITLEYIAVRDRFTLFEIPKVDAHTPIVILIAAKVGGVRLIDNIVLGDTSPTSI